MKKVLIIEDDQIVANIYRNKFVVEGYAVEVAGDGETGLQSVKSFRPDAVILDLMLPKISGIEVIHKIRSDPASAKLPVIVFSNTYLSNKVQEAWKAGATKCLSKINCTPRQIVEVVNSSIATAITPVAAATAPGARTAEPASKKLPDSEADTAFETNTRVTFLEHLPATLTTLRTLIKAMIKADTEAERLKQLSELQGHIRTLTGNAGSLGLLQIAQMSAALEALLQELFEKPGQINASTTRTVAGAIDFLSVLFEHARRPHRETPAPKILVVDDEVISRRAITHALEKAGLKCVNVEDPNLAFKLCSEQLFDLIFLDVDMPGMTGFELCTKIRALPTHKKTPVVFVTGLKDLESRASSMMSGGNDFIAKPFLFMELAVKSLVYVLRGKLEAVGKPAR